MVFDFIVDFADEFQILDFFLASDIYTRFYSITSITNIIMISYFQAAPTN